ncbi:choice-of-anchor Q domain-containing protein [Nibrella viscosa]
MPFLFYVLTLLLLGSATTQAAVPPTTQNPLRQLILGKLGHQPTVTLDLYVMSQCPYGVQAEQTLIPLVKELGPKVSFRLHYIVAPAAGQGAFRSLHGPAEVAENIRQLVIAERFPARWLDYLLARADNYRSDDWQAAARRVGIDVGDVQRLTQLPTASARLYPHSRQTAERRIRSSPTVLVDGELYRDALKAPTARVGASCTTDAECNDDNACTSDRCDLELGKCTNTPINCDDSNACTLDRCDPLTECSYEPLNCDDNNSATLDSCDPKKGCLNTLVSRVYVNQAVTASGDGTSWGQAFKTLTEALTAANTYASITEIWVAKGLYKPTSNTANRGASFSMKNNVAIYGGFNGDEKSLAARPAINPVTGSPSSTTLSGDIDDDRTLNGNSYHLFYNDGVDNTALLDGFVITGGNADDSGIINSGGGIFNSKSSNPSLTNCSFVGNQATYRGGAIYNQGIGLKLTNCSFVGNQAIGISSSTNEGGAIFSGGSLSLINCSFVNNQTTGSSNSNASRGGAIFNISSLSLINCSFVNNQVSGSRIMRGGAIYNQSGSSKPSLINCSFLGNLATGSSSSTNEGGAIYNDIFSSLGLTNCSFQNNSASGGGAIYNNGSSLSLTNCIVWNNGGSKAFFSNGGSSTVTYSLFDNTTNVGISEPGNLTTAVSPFSSTSSVALAAGSPAIDAGSDAAYTAANGPATDLAGNSRIKGCRIDMGAVEYQDNNNQPLAFTQQPPAATAVCAGAGVSVPVSMTGTVSGYQWYKDGGAVTGQTSATLTLSNVQTSDAGSYSLVVTGACNSLTSTAFSLTVNTPPTSVSLIGSGPLTCVQTSVTLTATAGGAGSYTLSNGQTNNTGVFVVTQPGPYTVTAASTSGCSATATTTVTSHTATATISNFVAGSNPLALGQPFSLTALLSQAANGTPAVIAWGDGTTTAGSVSGGQLTAQRSYTSAGVYSVTVSLAGNCPTSRVYQYAVVYDPTAGFVTGGGWIDSPVVDATICASCTFMRVGGKASFGFVAKYQKGKSLPTGDTDFKFEAGGLVFRSTAYEWLVVAGSKAQFKGTGSINGQGGYGFMLTATDGDLGKAKGPDRFRIKIWQTSSNQTVYDNQYGADDTADPSTQIGGGSIVIHDPNSKNARQAAGLEPVLVADAVLLSSAPNPVAERTTLRFMLPQGGRYQLAVTDLHGRAVAQWPASVAEAGVAYEVTWERGQTPGGVYVGLLRSEQGSKAIRLLLK